MYAHAESQCRSHVGLNDLNRRFIGFEALWRPFLLPLLTVSCRLCFLSLSVGWQSETLWLRCWSVSRREARSMQFILVWYVPIWSFSYDQVFLQREQSVSVWSCCIWPPLLAAHTHSVGPQLFRFTASNLFAYVAAVVLPVFLLFWLSLDGQ